jgi:cytoskeletal protein CcmA (bactofilin family)
MQRNTEESEWTRFSRALGASAPKPPAAPEPAAAPEPIDTPTVVDQPVEAAASEPTPVVEETPPPPPAPRPVISMSSTRTMPPVSDVESLIAPGMSIEGTVRSDHSIRVLGSVSGEIESAGNIAIEPGANLKAKVAASQIMIAGEVDGEIHCTGRVTIMSTGRVTGEIDAASLVMDEGAYFEGHLRMNRG